MRLPPPFVKVKASHAEVQGTKYEGRSGKYEVLKSGKLQNSVDNADNCEIFGTHVGQGAVLDKSLVRRIRVCYTAGHAAAGFFELSLVFGPHGRSDRPHLPHSVQGGRSRRDGD